MAKTIMASNIKTSLFLVTFVACLGLSIGEPQKKDEYSIENVGYKRGLRSEEDHAPRERMADPLTVLLQRRFPETRLSTQDALAGISAAVRNVMVYFQGFAPYLAKLAKPFIRIIMQILDRGQTFFVEYIRSLSPDTVKNFQTTLLDLFGKLFNVDLIRTMIQFALRGLV